jgi:hypothetical protein
MGLYFGLLIIGGALWIAAILFRDRTPDNPNWMRDDYPF